MNMKSVNTSGKKRMPSSPAELRTVEACAELLALTVAARTRIAELERTVATIAGLTAACETDVRGV